MRSIFSSVAIGRIRGWSRSRRTAVTTAYESVMMLPPIRQP